MTQDFMYVFLAAVEQQKQQKQREALAELLVWTMYADGHLALDEKDLLEEELSKVKWESDTPLRAFLLQAATKVRNAMASEDATISLLGEIAKRIDDDQARADALAAAERLAGADESMAVTEKSFIERVRRRFTLSE